jgi:signal transduction histidine kinase/CheY-like chemotaxis protein
MPTSVPFIGSSLLTRARGASGATLVAILAVAIIAAAAFAQSAVLIALAVGMTCGMCIATYARSQASTPLAGNTIDAPTAARILAPVLGHCEDAIVLTDASLRIRYANDAFTSLCDRIIDAPSETTVVEAVRHRIADGEGFAHAIAETRRTDRPASGEITHLGTPARTFEWRAIPLPDDTGASPVRAFVFHDRSQAQELAGLKSDFLSTVTHELRTPLTSVKGSLQLVLGKSTALSAIDSELLNISLKNADRLIRLINDLLDISRLELGKIELTFGRVPTASLLEEAVAGIRTYAGGREIGIDCDIDENVPALLGDRDRLIQVLTNLISNAVKFSPTSGHVRVAATRHAAEVAIAVQDWGIGIPAADQCRLFQRFERLNRGRSEEPGTGLGLAISKAIVERHGGRITLDSREQEGSTFTIFVPAFEEAPGRVTPDAHGGGASATILLVDDDDVLRADLERALADRYAVTCVRRGLDAVDVAREIRPDVVLLDVVLPDLSGYDVLRILRTTGATSSVPVIMLTVQPERALAASLGACDVVAKPVDLEQLRRAIEHALRDREVEPIERRAASR